MKQKIVPTSPKSETYQAVQEKKKQRANGAQPHLIFGVIVATLLIGSMAGFFGFVIAANVPPTTPVIGRLNVVALFEDAREETLLSTRQSTGSVVKKSPRVIEQIVTVYNGLPLLNSPADLLGNAVVLTSDGWMVMPTALLPEGVPAVNEESVVSETPNFVVVDEEGKTYSTILQRMDDPVTGLTFFQVANTIDLSVVSFPSDFNYSVGQNVSVIKKGAAGYVVYRDQIAGENDLNLTVHTTASANSSFVIDTGATQYSIGSPVFSGNGDLLGIMMEKGVMIPSSFLKGAVDSIVQNSEIQRTSLVVEYVNIRSLTDQDRTELGLPDNGLYVVSAPGTDVLKKGDVITKVSNDFVTDSFDLSGYFHSRPVGSSLYLTRVRNEVEETIELVLE